MFVYMALIFLVIIKLSSKCIFNFSNSAICVRINNWNGEKLVELRPLNFRPEPMQRSDKIKLILLRMQDGIKEERERFAPTYLLAV